MVMKEGNQSFYHYAVNCTANCTVTSTTNSTASSTVWNFHNLITDHKFLFGRKTVWKASWHSMWVTPHSLSIQSCPTGVTPYDFLCGVAPVGQLGMKGISVKV